MLKREIPTPIAIGIIVAILAVLGFFAVRSLFAPAPTVTTIPDFDAPPAGVAPTPPPHAPAQPVGEHPAPYRPPAGYGAPGGGR
ncbi:MAG: hypothetical protein RMJ83_01730 [Armatimonadota bacterium]|nr:hypothetical protein [Armatimonadota bacterium]